MASPTGQKTNIFGGTFFEDEVLPETLVLLGDAQPTSARDSSGQDDQTLLAGHRQFPRRPSDEGDTAMKRAYGFKQVGYLRTIIYLVTGRLTLSYPR